MRISVPRRAASVPLWFYLCLSSLKRVVIEASPMNGAPYAIANAVDPQNYRTDYPEAEFFDVYSEPIKTRYSEVYWKYSDAIDLPTDIKERFADSIIAIVGYEVDQVQTDKHGNDIPVPITWAYNHHYGAWLSNNKVKVHVEVPKGPQDKHDETFRPNSKRGASHTTPHGEFITYESLVEESELTQNPDIPSSHFFSEGNGGEFRGSYHGYPSGYAQLLESPTKFQVCPMQIDTWNRKDMRDNTTTYKPGPLPQSSRIPHNAGYNGLLECPCSTRLPKQYGMEYALLPLDEDKRNECTEEVQNATECFVGARKTVAADQYIEQQTRRNDAPTGCSLQQHSNGTVEILWNEKSDAEDTVTHKDPASRWISFAQGTINVTVALQKNDKDGDTVELTLVGPAESWFGVGFGTNTMCLQMEADECPTGGPYAIVVSGDAITERKLDYHGPGVVLEPSVTVVSNTVEESGDRTIVLRRPWVGKTKQHYTFQNPSTASTSSLPIITAKGCDTLIFGQHCGHGPSTLRFLSMETPYGLCQAGIQGTIGGNSFPKNRCPGPPTSDLAFQHNPTCSIETYVGGLECCRHNVSLLDDNQEVPWPDQYLEYRLKFRFYFQEYHPATDSSPASHQNLVRLYWQTEAFAGEYDVVQCLEGTPPEQCVHTITSRWKVRDMVDDCSLHKDGPSCCGVNSTNANETAGVELIYAGPHCHAPTCLSMELYNADTGLLLCHVEPIHGESDDGLYDERGFLSIPPCLWGNQDGLMKPQLLSLDTTLMAIKRNNNTLPHTGEMASWQMRGVVVPKLSAKTRQDPLDRFGKMTADRTSVGAESLEEERREKSLSRQSLRGGE